MRTQPFFKPGILILFSLILSPSLALARTQDDIPPIVRYMKRVNSDLRNLRRLVRDVSGKGQALVVIADMRENLLAAREENPLKTPEIPENEREGFLKAYKEMLDRVLVDLDSLGKAVEDEKLDKAQELTRKLYDWKKEGHKRFQKDPDS